LPAKCHTFLGFLSPGREKESCMINLVSPQGQAPQNTGFIIIMPLLYRGQSFNFQAASAVATQLSGSLTRTLLYRGQSYRFNTAGARPTCLPHAINWRYSLPCEAAKGILTPAH
jgi:hypothetical protein